MDGIDVTLFERALGEHNWTLVAAFAILMLVRLSKMSVIGNYWEKIPKQYRPLVVVALGVMSGVGEAIVEGRAWLPALIFGLVSGLLAIGADQVVTKPLNKPPESSENAK